MTEPIGPLGLIVLVEGSGRFRTLERGPQYFWIHPATADGHPTCLNTENLNIRIYSFIRGYNRLLVALVMAFDLFLVGY